MNKNMNFDNARRKLLLGAAALPLIVITATMASVALPTASPSIM